MFEEQIIKKYGKRMWKKMQDTGLLDGITVELIDGKMSIPEIDLERAYCAVKGIKCIHAMD